MPQVLALEWSSGMETLRCAGRVDLTLTGSFADMILLPSAGSTWDNHKSALAILTNPGQLHLYDDSGLSASLSKHDRKASIFPVEFPVIIPTADPSMTVAKFATLPMGGSASEILAEVALTPK